MTDHPDPEECAATPWYELAFGPLYPVVYPHRDLEAAHEEARQVVRWLDLDPGSRILDVGCGTGRHVIALESMGMRVIGGDLSVPLLKQARDQGCRRLLRSDMRQQPLSDGSFDAVVSFFSSFGYFSDESDDRRVIDEYWRVLAPQGRCFIDYLHVPTLRRGLVPRTVSERGGYRLIEERRIEGKRVKKHVRILSLDDDEEPLVYEESVRLYEVDELHAMVEAAGFRVTASWGSFEELPIGEGKRVLVVAERPR